LIYLDQAVLTYQSYLLGLILIASSSLNPLALNFNPVNDPTIQDLLQQVNDIREEILSLNLQILLISDPEYVALNPDAAETGSVSSAFSTLNQSQNDQQFQTP
jgi:hypothetical protein